MIIATIVCQVNPLQFAANLTMAQHLVGQKDILGPYWTLYFELIFYLLILALYVLGSLVHPRNVALASVFFLTLVIALSYVGGDGGPIFLGFLTAGTVYRFAFLRGKASKWAILVTASLLVSAVFASGMIWPVPANLDENFKPVGICSAMVLSVVVFLIWIKTEHTNILREWIGERSYSLYLLHYIFLELAIQLVLPPTAYGLLIIPCTLILSEISYRFVERPFVRLGKKESERRFSVPGSAQITASLP